MPPEYLVRWRYSAPDPDERGAALAEASGSAHTHLPGAVVAAQREVLEAHAANLRQRRLESG